MDKRYWLIPPEIYGDLNAEFNFDYDPCPCPLPEGHNALEVDWGRVNYVNPPFRKKDALGGYGPTSFVRKAIDEQRKGKTSIILLPVQHYVNLLMEAGAELRSMGRIPWLEVDTKERWKSPIAIGCFVLRGK